MCKVSLQVSKQRNCEETNWLHLLRAHSVRNCNFWSTSPGGCCCRIGWASFPPAGVDSCWHVRDGAILQLVRAMRITSPKEGWMATATLPKRGLLAIFANPTNTRIPMRIDPNLIIHFCHQLNCSCCARKFVSFFFRSPFPAVVTPSFNKYVPIDSNAREHELRPIIVCWTVGNSERWEGRIWS